MQRTDAHYAHKGRPGFVGGSVPTYPAAIKNLRGACDNAGIHGIYFSSGMSPSAINDIVTEINAHEKSFPGMFKKGGVTAIGSEGVLISQKVVSRTNALGNRTFPEDYAGCVFPTSGGKKGIAFEFQTEEMYQARDRSYKQSKRTTQLATSDFRGTVAHEIGHIVDGVVRDKRSVISARGDTPKKSEDRRIRNRAMSQAYTPMNKFSDPESSAQIKKEQEAHITNGLSRYALTNHKEFFAEAWGEYRTSPSPRPMAKAIGEAATAIMENDE